MAKIIYLGRGQQMLEVPQDMWKQHLALIPQHAQERLSFMTEAHHQVRYFVVKELVQQGRALTPEMISASLKLPLEQVRHILDELESKLFFLTRDTQGAVAWAYPVTVEPTPHRLSFSTGEQGYAA